MENNFKILDAYGKEVKEVNQEELKEIQKKNQKMVKIDEHTFKEQVVLKG
jgi:hypothetical protein